MYPNHKQWTVLWKVNQTFPPYLHQYYISGFRDVYSDGPDYVTTCLHHYSHDSGLCDVSADGQQWRSWLRHHMLTPLQPCFRISWRIAWRATVTVLITSTSATRPVPSSSRPTCALTATRRPATWYVSWPSVSSVDLHCDLNKKTSYLVRFLTFSIISWPLI